MRKTLTWMLIGVTVLLAAPSAALAQSNSNIAGVVKDGTGAVVPGVKIGRAHV